MATSAILTVLANIPWGQVIDNAPKLAEGAAKLWQTVSRRPKAATRTTESSSANQPLQTEAEATAQRLRDLELSLATLEEQMRASAELIQSMSQQNTQLVARVEWHRQQLRRLVWALVGVGGLCMALLVYVILVTAI